MGIHGFAKFADPSTLEPGGGYRCRRRQLDMTRTRRGTDGPMGYVLAQPRAANPGR